MKKNVLIITSVNFLALKKDGGQYAVYSIIEYLSNFFNIDILYCGEKNEELISENKPFCFNIYPILRNQNQKSKIIKTIKYLLPLKIINFIRKIKKPKTLDIYEAAELTTKFIELQHQKKYDFILFQFIWFKYLLDYILDNSVKTIIDTHDIIHRRNERYAKKNVPIEIYISKEEEVGVLNRFNYVLAIQKEEGAYLSSLLETNVLVAPRPFPIRQFLPKDNYKLKVIFFGSGVDFNRDAITWFYDNLKDFFKNSSKFELHIYGMVCEFIDIKNEKNIYVHGTVEHVEDVYKEADIVINPIRFGAGLKIKNIEAMSFGIPLLTSSIGKEGLEGYEDNCYIECNTPEEYLMAIKKLEDLDMRFNMSNNAIDFVSKNLNDEACYGALLREMI